MKKKIIMFFAFLTLLLAMPMKQVNAEELKPLSFLLLGTDTGALDRTETGRSDVLMVVTLNPQAERATITSIPRDTYTEIIGEGFMDKINHAYAFGGAEMSKATVNHLLDINLDHYVVVNMGGLEQIIDALGGVEVVPPTTFEISGYTFYEGEPTLVDGAMALAYARERYDSGGDYARQERQRELIQAIINKASSLDSVLNFKDILTALGSNMETDMNFLTMMNIFSKYQPKIKTFESYQLSGFGQMIDGVWYDVVDETELSELIERLHTELGKL